MLDMLAPIPNNQAITVAIASVSGELYRRPAIGRAESRLYRRRANRPAGRAGTNVACVGTVARHAVSQPCLPAMDSYRLGTRGPNSVTFRAAGGALDLRGRSEYGFHVRHRRLRRPARVRRFSRARLAAARVSRLRQLRRRHASTLDGRLHDRQGRRPHRQARRKLAQTARPAARSASATRAGPRTARRPTRTPIRTSAATALVAVVHNGVIENFRPLKRTARSARLSLPLGDRHRSDRPPDRQAAWNRNWPIAADRRRPKRWPSGYEPLRHAPCARRLPQLHGTYGLARRVPRLSRT